MDVEEEEESDDALLAQTLLELLIRATVPQADVAAAALAAAPAARVKMVGKSLVTSPSPASSSYTLHTKLFKRNTKRQSKGRPPPPPIRGALS